MNDTDTIERLMGEHLAAVRRKDVEGAMALVAPDILRYDLAPPLAVEGAETCREGLRAWFATWDGPIGYEERGRRTTASGDLAVSTAFVRISGVKKDGPSGPPVWARATSVLERRDGQWRLTHEHISTPFYMDGSVRAAIDLSPPGIG